jgi:hypothetical protein
MVDHENRGRIRMVGILTELMLNQQIDHDATGNTHCYSQDIESGKHLLLQ